MKPMQIKIIIITQKHLKTNSRIMKKLLLSASLIFSLGILNAQDMKKVSSSYLLNKFEDAKTEIDKVSSDPKAQAKPEFWFWKASIYGAIYDDKALNVRYPYAGETAFAAFKKYAELEPTFKTMNESPIPGKAAVDFLYRGTLTQGIGFFDKKQWDSSFRYFSKAAEIGDLITKYNWRGNKQAIDTTTVLFAGYAAQNSKKADDAAKYYTRIANLKITYNTAAGEMKDIYEYLVFYYLERKNTADFNKYLALAKELYPKSIDSWADYETEYIEKNYSLAEKTAAYDKGDADGSLTANQYLAYGNMFYNLKEEEKTGLDSTKLISYRNKAEDAFMKGYNKDKTNGLAAYNAALISYNEWVMLDDKFEENIKKVADLNRRKTTEKDIKKKAAFDPQISSVKADNARIEKVQHGFADKAIQWMENAYQSLSPKKELDRSEKPVINKSVDYLANLYLWKRDKSKGNNAEYDKYDALYKKYDALHK
jgi:hypothetical protein